MTNPSIKADLDRLAALHRQIVILVQRRVVPAADAIGGLEALVRMWGGDTTPVPNASHWTPWRTLMIGNMTKLELILATHKHLSGGDWDWQSKATRGVLEHSSFAVESASRIVDFVHVSVNELGFSENTRTRDVFARAEDLGLQRCPAEVGPQLVLNVYPWARAESYWVAMDPVGRDEQLFRVGSFSQNDEKPSLRAVAGSRSRPWKLFNRFVFIAPRP